MKNIVAPIIICASMAVGAFAKAPLVNLFSNDKGENDSRVTLAEDICSRAGIQEGIMDVAFENAVWTTTSFAGKEDIRVSYDEAFTQWGSQFKMHGTCVKESREYLGRQLLISWAMSAEYAEEAEQNGLMGMLQQAYNTPFVSGKAQPPVLAQN